VLAVLVLAGGAVLHLAPLEWAAMVLAIALVVTVELLNTALEAVVDLASPELHPLAKHAKDVAAAAVLNASLGAVAVGAFVLWSHLAR
jgi:undecaprenol kinase